MELNRLAVIGCGAAAACKAFPKKSQNNPMQSRGLDLQTQRA
jgi:hypothetical protein